MCNCNFFTNFDYITTIIQIFFSILACLLAILIPKKIQWEQLYDTLGDEYRSYDYGAAVQGIVEFWNIDCKCNPGLIKEMYEKRFLMEVYNIKSKKVYSENNDELYETYLNNRKYVKNNNQASNDKILHYQRRLLAQFFYKLDLCSKSIFIGRKRVGTDYTCREADIIKLLYIINNAIDDSKIIMKKLCTDERINSVEKSKGLNKYLSHLYNILRCSNKYMEVKK